MSEIVERWCRATAGGGQARPFSRADGHGARWLVKVAARPEELRRPTRPGRRHRLQPATHRGAAAAGNPFSVSEPGAGSTARVIRTAPIGSDTTCVRPVRPPPSPARGCRRPMSATMLRPRTHGEMLAAPRGRARRASVSHVDDFPAGCRCPASPARRARRRWAASRNRAWVATEGDLGDGRRRSAAWVMAPDRPRRRAIDGLRGRVVRWWRGPRREPRPGPSGRR